MKSRMQHQGGWAATFVVVGIVLALGLAGGIYYLKTHMNNDVAISQPDTSSEIEKTLNDAGKQNDEKDTNNDSAKDQPDQKNETPAKNSTPSKDTTSDDTAGKDKAGTLPETGPADALAQLVAVAALTVSSVAYIRSR